MTFWTGILRFLRIGGGSVGKIASGMANKSIFYISFTSLVLVILLWSAAVESWEQQTPTPLLMEAGSLAFAQDYKIEQKTRFIIEEKFLEDKADPQEEGIPWYLKWWRHIAIFFAGLNAYAQLAFTFYIYLIVLKFIFFLWQKNPLSNSSEDGRNLIFSIITLGALQIVYFAITFKELRYPIEGLVFFVMNFPALIENIKFLFNFEEYRRWMSVNVTEVADIYNITNPVNVSSS